MGLKHAYEPQHCAATVTTLGLQNAAAMPSVQERVWMLEEMCIDIGVNVCVDTFEHVYGHKHGHVYRHVYQHMHGHVYRHVYRHLYGHV